MLIDVLYIECKQEFDLTLFLIHLIFIQQELVQIQRF